jgi:hypothetical protein
MVLSAVIQYETNLVLYTVESAEPINTAIPDYVIDITNYVGEVIEGMYYNSNTQEFETIN